MQKFTLETLGMRVFTNYYYYLTAAPEWAVNDRKLKGHYSLTTYVI
jgi:hypothetical protein